MVELVKFILQNWGLLGILLAGPLVSVIVLATVLLKLQAQVVRNIDAIEDHMTNSNRLMMSVLANMNSLADLLTDVYKELLQTTKGVDVLLDRKERRQRDES